jgi:hypothetical protein
MTEQQNSLAEGLALIARSKTARPAFLAAWPYFLAALTASSAWIVRTSQLEPRVTASEQRETAMAKDLSEIKMAMLTLVQGEQQKLLTVGRQAAYATAGFEAYETPKVQKQKRDYAEKYAAAYERMVLGGETPAHALVALWSKVDVP